MWKIHTKIKVNMANLKNNQNKITGRARNLPLAALNCKKAQTHPLSAKDYESQLDMVDDLALVKIIKARKGRKTVKVKLKQL